MVLERAPELRRGGQNVDVRGAGREVLRRMELEDAVRAGTTGEVGTRFVGTRGETIAEFPAGTSDSGGATAELEILRGDLAALLIDRSQQTAWLTIPRTASDDNWWRWFTATDGRTVTLRPDPVGTIRATLSCLTSRGRTTGVTESDQLGGLRQRFSGAGWETQRILAKRFTTPPADRIDLPSFDHLLRG